MLTQIFSRFRFKFLGGQLFKLLNKLAFEIKFFDLFLCGDRGKLECLFPVQVLLLDAALESTIFFVGKVEGLIVELRVKEFARPYGTEIPSSFLKFTASKIAARNMSKLKIAIFERASDERAIFKSAPKKDTGFEGDIFEGSERK